MAAETPPYTYMPIYLHLWLYGDAEVEVEVDWSAMIAATRSSVVGVWLAATRACGVEGKVALPRSVEEWLWA